VVDAAKAAGVECAAFTVEALHPWEALVDHAKAQSCDLIVMASHGRRGVSALLLGSETQKVLTHCSVPVLVVK
jgi:nucleotide-binding universal stress UspA family protein